MYCSEVCRKREPHRSLVMRIYHASENAAEARGFTDYADFDGTTLDEYRRRVAGALKQADLGQKAQETSTEVLNTGVGQTRP